MHEKFKKFCHKLANLIFTDNNACIVCDKELKEKSPNGLCDSCKSELVKNDTFCQKCGTHIKNDAIFCNVCQKEKREFDCARSVYIYDDMSSKLVKNLKFGHKKYYAKYMAYDMVSYYFQNNLSCDIALAVPVSKSRLSERGYNQAEEIAKVFCKQTNIPLSQNNTQRVKDTKAQTLILKKEREENLQNAFVVKDTSAYEGKDVLIIDDVFTTGATVNALSREVLKCKPKSITVLAYASTWHKNKV